ncbi:MAG: transposase [Fretibacterium sp.]|nr:transposase [Fretibacterium sp.]
MLFREEEKTYDKGSGCCQCFNAGCHLISTGKGREHDFSIFQESKVHFTRWAQVIADKGYQGIQKLHFNSVVPIRVKKGRSLSVPEKLYNSLVSKCRIYIEHINRYIKRFRIFPSRYRNRRKKFGLRFSLACGLYHFQHG